MTFHNVDESYSIVEVEKNLRVDNLCELLRIKNQFKPGDWRIVETWPKLDVTIGKFSCLFIFKSNLIIISETRYSISILSKAVISDK